ncbi:hypothetical protein BGZ46_007849 [Entomortierella lignicola]|nr:hypothetical protein BGZ46_007849 [Entomortierella lignicola]
MNLETKSKIKLELQFTWVEVLDATWPLYYPDDDTSFVAFIERFEHIFSRTKLPQSKKFACLQRCLSQVDPSLIHKTRAYGDLDYTTAINRLIPALSVPDLDSIDVTWPQLSLSTTFTFDEFLVRLNRTFKATGLPLTEKVTCLRRCLPEMDQSLLDESRVFDDTDFDLAIQRLRPLFVIPSADIADVDWPQFTSDDDTLFDDFIDRFERLFTRKRFPVSTKFRCFKRCLIHVDPTLLRNSHAMDEENYDIAVERLRPLLEITEEQRLENLHSQYAAIAQKHGQSVQTYFHNFLRLNNTHALEPRHSLRLLYTYLTAPYRQHLALLYSVGKDAGDSVKKFHGRLQEFLEDNPLSPPPPSAAPFVPHNPLIRDIPPSVRFAPCTHCKRKGHPSDRCCEKFPHLRPAATNPLPLNHNIFISQNIYCSFEIYLGKSKHRTHQGDYSSLVSELSQHNIFHRSSSNTGENIPS